MSQDNTWLLPEGIDELLPAQARALDVVLDRRARRQPRDGADVVVAVGDDPLIVAGAHGQGRGVAFTSDCGPHWCPPPFVDWEGYAPMWQQLVRWVAG